MMFLMSDLVDCCFSSPSYNGRGSFQSATQLVAACWCRPSAFKHHSKPFIHINTTNPSSLDSNHYKVIMTVIRCSPWSWATITNHIRWVLDQLLCCLATSWQQVANSTRNHLMRVCLIGFRHNSNWRLRYGQEGFTNFWTANLQLQSHDHRKSNGLGVPLRVQVNLGEQQQWPIKVNM